MVKAILMVVHQACARMHDSMCSGLMGFRIKITDDFFCSPNSDILFHKEFDGVEISPHESVQLSSVVADSHRNPIPDTIVPCCPAPMPAPSSALDFIDFN
jgi:hypothetical protein